MRAAVLSGLGLTVTLAAAPVTMAWNNAPDPVETCDRAARIAARAHGVPLDVLRAITRTETGRRGDDGLEPWPWTVNMEGAGHWFASRDEALAYVFRHFKRGARSFDVGCFQINFKWHGSAFRSVEDMFDPEKNARYAARFLTHLYTELGDWSAAAGAYHSRTPGYAKAYRARFDSIRASLKREPARSGRTTMAARAAGPRPLTGAGTLRLGSLVPMAGAEGIRGALIPLVSE